MTSRALSKPYFDVFEGFFAVFGYTAGRVTHRIAGCGKRMHDLA